MHTTRTAEPSADLPDVRTHRAQFRTVLTEVQRLGVAGGWSTVAVAETPEWAATITAALNWLEYNPVFSETA